MWRCERCGENKFNTPGKCICTEFVVIDVDGEEFKYFAYDDEGAAEKHAEYANEEGGLMNDSLTVTVTDGGGATKKYVVGAEPDVNYTAREIEEGDDAKT